jgi:DNA mismatch repair protein MutS
VIGRARDVLKRLEAGRAATGGLAAGLDDLPLFAAAIQAEEEKKDALRDTLAAIDVDTLSPRDALDALYRLKAVAEDS